ncbi:MAG TPA: nucleotidyltransferase domain-containing protein [Candidatus Nanoarchaeia archaeon]|nr:nucleotidyltransferase domain-containing protein [Candidatus Nanoarchaeia archaeon]
MENNLKRLDFAPSKEEVNELQKQAKEVINVLKKNIKADKINAQIFLGGSFAKETMVRKDNYDIDVFIRINKENFDNDLKKLEKTVSKSAKQINSKIETLHGSRDYYQITRPGKNVIIEIIPVLKINKPEQAENVTDLSYFHVDYIKKKIKKKQQREVRLAKMFFDACGCYGAESYIQGFSGYATECLIAKYGTFNSMLKALTKEDKIIVDPAKQYRNPKEALIALNEAKIQSPVIIIDPTWKKRNALASLSQETYSKFRKAAVAYLKKPSINYFEKKEVNLSHLKEQAKKLNAEFTEIEIKTDRQEGDIAGTKLKKAARFILVESEKEHKIIRHEFVYDLNKSARVYLISKRIEELFVSGPPIKMIEHVKAFKREHEKTFEKKGKICTVIKNNLSLAEYLKNKVLNGKKLRSMGIVKARIV